MIINTVIWLAFLGTFVSRVIYITFTDQPTCLSLALSVTVSLYTTFSLPKWSAWKNIRNGPGGKVSILGGHSIGHSKQKKCICTCVLFQTVSEIELFHCTLPKLLIRKRYYVLFLIPAFIVQVTKLQSLPGIIHFWKFRRQHQCTLQLVWGHVVLLVCTVYSVLYSEIALSRKPFGIGHMYIYTSIFA
jgi:hypothetical protein